MSGITLEYPTHPTVLGLGLGLRLGLGLVIRVGVRVVYNRVIPNEHYGSVTDSIVELLNLES